MIDHKKRQLIHQASNHTYHMLEGYNNKLNNSHAKDINTIITGFVDSIDGNDIKLAFPLYTGGGKSTCIRGLLMALHELDLDYSVVISAGYVKALCDLRQSLIDDGIPLYKIGLIHSQDSADILSDDHHEASNRQFVLVTHSRIKTANGTIPEYFFYNGVKRDLLIWDEALLSGHSVQIRSEKLMGAIALANTGFNCRFLDNESKSLYLPLVNYLNSINQKLVDAQSSESKDFQMNFDIFPYDLQTTKFKIESLLFAPGEKKVARYVDCLVDFIEGVKSIEHIRYMQLQNSSLVYFIQTLPSELDSIVVLDASHNIRELTRCDKTINVIELESSKSYGELTINYFINGSGRELMEKEFENGIDSDIVKEVVGIIVDIIDSCPGEKIVVWTHNKREIDIAEIILNALRMIFLDIDFEIEDENKLRLVNFLTFGREQGINSLSSCTHTVFCGLLHQPKAALAMSLKGQSKNNELDVFEGNALSKASFGEQASSMYQAISRGSSRGTIEGRCLKHSVYFFDKNYRRIQAVLDQVFPDAKWIRYKTKHLHNATSEAYQNVIKVSDRLSSLTDEEAISHFGESSIPFNKVSARMLRSIFPDINNIKWKQMTIEFDKNHLPWIRVGRSFVKRIV